MRIPRPSLLDRYLFGRLLITFFFMLVMLLVVVLVIDFAEKLDDFLEKRPTAKELVVDYYINLFIFYGNTFSPVCVFLSVIFFVGRLAQRSEIIAMLSAGIGYYRLMLPLLAAGAVLMVGSLLLNLYVVPQAVSTRMEFEFTYIISRPEIAGRNLHRRLDEHTYLYMWNYNQVAQMGYRPTLEHFDGPQLQQRLVAERMRWVDSVGAWRFQNGHIRTLGPLGETLEPFLERDTVLDLVPQDLVREENYLRRLALPDLLAFIKRESQRGSAYYHELLLEFHQRLAIPMATLVLTAIGLALSTRKRRGGLALNLGLGFVLTFVYVLLLMVLQSIFGQDYPAWLVTWAPNFLFTALAVYMLWRATRS